MKFAFSMMAAALLALPVAAAAQTGTLAADLRADWDGQQEQITAIAQAMPEAMWNYKATDAQRTYGEQVMHIVQVNQFLLGMLGGTVEAPAINMEATAKADVMQALTQSYEYGARVLAGLSDQQLLEAVDAAFMGRSTRARVVAFAFSHTMDIYGQLVVYLRLNGIVPPASQGV